MTSEVIKTEHWWTDPDELLVAVGGLVSAEVAQHLVEQLDAVADLLQSAAALGGPLGPHLVLKRRQQQQ